MVLISIVIPVCNVEQYVQRCLKFVQAQVYEDTNLECIIVDDCSPDKSMYFVNSMLLKYEGKIQYRVIKHEKNCGLSVALFYFIYSNAASDFLHNKNHLI